jgi:hypothetical protein
MKKERFWYADDGADIFCKSKASFCQENNSMQFVYLKILKKYKTHDEQIRISFVGRK